MTAVKKIQSVISTVAKKSRDYVKDELGSVDSEQN